MNKEANAPRYLDLTEKHIEHAGKNTTTCPVARCLNANTDSLYSTEVSKYEILFEERSYSVGFQLSTAIRRYDEGNPMKPVRLKITRNTEPPKSQFSPYGEIEIA